MKSIDPEYLEFKGDTSSNKKTPMELYDLTKKHVSYELKKQKVLLFTKLLSSHAFAGSLSLAVCHQFGLNPFQTEVSLADWLMNMGGHSFCMTVCGMFFISSSLICSLLLFNEEERWMALHSKTSLISLLIAVSIGAFALLGVDLVLQFTLLWIIGAALGGSITLFAALWLENRTQTA